jgi:hypothetical protein
VETRLLADGGEASHVVAWVTPEGGQDGEGADPGGIGLHILDPIGREPSLEGR